MSETPPAPATGAAADATSAQTEAAAAAAAEAATGTATPPATDGTEALGDPGKRALDAMKRERDDAVKAAKKATERATELETASKSDNEKALDAAKKEGNLEATTKLSASIRRSEVKAALTGAGVNAAFLDLAVRADEFAALEIDDEGNVAGIDEAVAAFKGSHPDVFKGSGPAPGTSDGGTRGGTKVTKEQVASWTKDPVEYEKHRDEILNWMSTQSR